ncbi:hypothetical protein HN014_19995 [Aquimarina sp. TRL1]|uniref:hypothetical protein n=1 Tax=Aquimarina sp. (strain TRL1) TaxID=2736252 RepID=UPI00158DC858|nr:hypothetical protein [Aquimarina sp. TRL1]QKX07099.1 hypothetical protein HN014_19995 [Aquimarina sp. TRL1]
MSQKKILFFLKILVSLIFIGRAWQHLFWDAPYRSFFWDEAMLKPVIESLTDMSWQAYVTSASTDQLIQNIILANGIIYLLAAISALFINFSNKKWLQIPIIIGGVFLVILSLLLYKEKFYHSAQFFEHSIQFGLPFVLLYFLKNNGQKRQLSFILKILIAVTFFSHGLYAFGFYPVPGKFVDMVIQIFHCSERTAVIFLYIAGILDFILAVLIFIPRVAQYALWYAVFWGLLTALARIVANVYFDFFWQSVHQNLYEVVYRIPHGLTPLLVLKLAKKRLSFQTAFS